MLQAHAAAADWQQQQLNAVGPPALAMTVT
jgi:hypothetical protein